MVPARGTIEAITERVSPRGFQREDADFNATSHSSGPTSSQYFSRMMPDPKTRCSSSWTIFRERLASSSVQKPIALDACAVLPAAIEDGDFVPRRDLESYRRWHDYSRARDEMFEASDTEWGPWFVVRSDDKRRARFSVIHHLLDHIPYERIAKKSVKLPNRQPRGDYKRPDYPFKFVPEHDWPAVG